MKYELVIGLETHVELSTDSKLFCSCGGHSSPKEPNDCVCPACSGMPGMLPVTNKHAIELAVKAGFMLNCKINQYTTFDKKSYYYPDLPCAYQITQWFNPICVDGCVDLGERKIGIKQIHVEEDAGKLVHDEATNTSFVDFNRTSVPLIEIVSRPDFRSADEVITYLKKLKSSLQFAGISECEEGAMRCDVNISVRPEGSNELGVRSEIKNMSSLSEIKDAIEFEKVRHVDAIERHTEVLVQETRRWDDVKRRTFPMRNKETAADYRYFPDPNLMPIVIDDAWLEEIRASMPATAEEKAGHYEEMGIAAKEAGVLASDRKLSDTFDKVVAMGCSAKTAASWILTECMGQMKRLELTSLEIEPAKLARIIELVEGGEITRAAGKKVLSAVFENDVDVDAYCEENSLNAKIDNSFILETVCKVIAENGKAVEDYKNGKVKAMQSLFGCVMKELRGNGSPDVIREMLEAELNK
ncbi:MAG: Asp-tRNA(Asn)/Glu-tRNA(Gln) amidotransferase subunit GatB [Ruminococcaceae bacterium]|nr:Asp-tRNA(Asn)/Glu-tRNA(Gln) amidotransferase subunit GatB [Oscillospiraceae bacterium]